MIRRSTTIAVGALAVLGGTSLLVPVGPMRIASAAATATPTWQRDLQLMRDEERMARDLYRVVAARYDGLLPFSRVRFAEQQHFASVGTMLTRYGVVDPARDRASGRYANTEIQRLSDGWLAHATGSREEAFQVGIELEKRDIADLQRAIARTTRSDVRLTYQRLLNGSRHHLAAFTAAAAGTLPMMGGQGPTGMGLASGAHMAGGCQAGQAGSRRGTRRVGAGAGQGRGGGPGMGRRMRSRGPGGF